MRIAFTGASGTGKTSIIEEIMKSMKNIEFVPVGARSVAVDMGFDNPYDTDVAALDYYTNCINIGLSVSEAASIAKSMYKPGDSTVRAMFQNTVQATKIAWEKSHTSIISDRSTIDDMIYSIIHCPEIVNSEFIDRSIAHAMTYDVIFMTRTEDMFNLGDDPSRHSNTKYHATFQCIVMAIVQSNDVLVKKMIKVPSGTPADRAEFCMKYINNTLDYKSLDIG